ncbi:hypothetical protein V8G54_006614 [Vigna mungo]|uniref:Uncharacterized protein n=1 Tax=Vigna mungo TaxID=3915 RepID=A0AAQ3S6K8_VIGMU
MGRGASAAGGQSSLGYLFGSREPASNVQSANQAARTQNASAPSPPVEKGKMGRGASAAGGQSSLGYLFGSREPASNVQSANQAARTQNASAPSPPVEKQQSPAPVEKQISPGIPGSLKNNYHFTDDQNCGNFLTNRPSTKVHAAPGGGSSMGYLFGGPPGTN